MKNVSLLKKIKLFLQYRTLLKENKDIIINGDSGLRIDKAYRMYTVLNIPNSTIDYGDKITKEFINDYLSKIDIFLNKLNFTELIAIYSESKFIDKNNYLIVLGFSGLNTTKIFNRLRDISIFFIISLIIFFVIH